MKRIFLFVNNRMYCEYFKLYKLICSYVIENVTDKKILEIIKGNTFQVYKDLEPFKDYKFEIERSTRININYSEEYRFKPWRFYIKDNPYVSKVKIEHKFKDE